MGASVATSIGCVSANGGAHDPLAFDSNGHDSLTAIDSLAWLAGSWADAGEDWRWEEHWMAPGGGTMIGMSRMVQRGATSFTEGLRLEQRADGIYYIVRPSEQTTSEYRLVEHAGRQAVFVSASNRTPHTLGYRLLPNGGLMAWTENEQGGREWKEFFPMRPDSLR